MEEEIDIRPSVYIIQIMDLSDNILMESNTTILGVPEVIELTVNDTSLLNQLDGHVTDMKMSYNI